MCDSNEYQVSFPSIFGGPTGDYTIIPPWNGPCDMAILAVSSGGSTGGAAYIAQTATAEMMSSIATTSKAGNNGTPGIYLDGNSPYFVSPTWFPIDGTLSMQVANNSTGILVTCVFRKKRVSTQSIRMQSIFDQPETGQERVSSASQSGTMPQTGSRLAPNARK